MGSEWDWVSRADLGLVHSSRSAPRPWVWNETTGPQIRCGIIIYRIIRLTSPNLNYLIGFGVILVYISTAIFFVEPTTNASTAGVLCIVSIVVYMYVRM